MTSARRARWIDDGNVLGAVKTTESMPRRSLGNCWLTPVCPLLRSRVLSLACGIRAANSSPCWYGPAKQLVDRHGRLLNEAEALSASLPAGGRPCQLSVTAASTRSAPQWA